MKKTELVLVIIWVAFFLLLGIDYPGNSQIFWLATIFLSAFYLLGSYKLFNPKVKSSPIISIIAGVAFATSLITIPYSILLNNRKWLQIMPAINLIFTIFMIGFICIRLRRKVHIENYLKSILLRSIIVLVVTCFFASRLSGNSVYRNTIIYLNAGYECKAQKLYVSNKNWEALENYIKADSFLNINPASSNNWERNLRVLSKNNIGLCYDRLSQYDSAAVYFGKAIKYHVDSIGEINTDLSTYLNNLARSLGSGKYWSKSNQMALKSIYVLDKDSISEDKENNYSRAYLQLVFNAIAENKLKTAREYLTKSENFLTPEQTCRYLLYSSGLYLQLDSYTQSISYAWKAKECYIHNFDNGYQNVAESFRLLFEAWTRVPNYDSAFNSIQQGMDITKANYGKQSARFHDYLKREAYYYYLVGSYKKSLTRYLEVARVYEQEFGPEYYKLPEILTRIGRIEIELGANDEALHYANESLRIAELNDLIYDDRATSLLNDVAYIKYATGQDLVADTLYNYSIELSRKMANDSSLSVASAINGSQ